MQKCHMAFPVLPQTFLLQCSRPGKQDGRQAELPAVALSRNPPSPKCMFHSLPENTMTDRLFPEQRFFTSSYKIIFMEYFKVLVESET